MPVTINGTSGITTPAGTVSGPLVISQNNSTGIAAISLPLDESTIQGPATNTAIRMGGNLVLRASNQASIDTNNVGRIIVDSSGRVTTPAQPAFLVTMTNTTIASNTILVFTEIQNNVGSYYNSSNGRFTAPVAGVYSISFGALSGQNSTVYRTTLYRNGNTLLINSNPDVAQIRLDCSSGIDFLQGAKTINVYLNANDFLTIHFGADDASSYTNSTWTFFSGFLVG